MQNNHVSARWSCANTHRLVLVCSFLHDGAGGGGGAAVPVLRLLLLLLLHFSSQSPDLRHSNTGDANAVKVPSLFHCLERCSGSSKGCFTSHCLCLCRKLSSGTRNRLFYSERRALRNPTCATHAMFLRGPHAHAYNISPHCVRGVLASQLTVEKAIQITTSIYNRNFFYELVSLLVVF